MSKEKSDREGTPGEEREGKRGSVVSQDEVEGQGKYGHGRDEERDDVEEQGLKLPPTDGSS